MNTGHCDGCPLHGLGVGHMIRVIEKCKIKNKGFYCSKPFVKMVSHDNLCLSMD